MQWSAEGLVLPSQSMQRQQKPLFLCCKVIFSIGKRQRKLGSSDTASIIQPRLSAYVGMETARFACSRSVKGTPDVFSAASHGAITSFEKNKT